MDRREFMKKSLAASAGLALGCSDSSPAKTRAEQLFGRGDKLDVEKLLIITIKADNAFYTPSSEEIKLYAQFVPSHENVRGKQVLQTKFDGAIEWWFMRAEPDDAYAQRYIKQTKLSIEHAKSFFDFPELNDISVKFVVPKTPREAIIDDGPLKVYLVAHLAEKKSLGFYATLKDEATPIMVPINSKQILQGKYVTDAGIVPDNGKIGLTPIKKRAIFCSTTGSLEALICSPIGEFMHSKFKTPFYEQWDKQFQGVTNASVTTFTEGFRELQEREEKFIHALGILWLEQYNKDRNLGFSGESLKEYFTKQEASSPCYKGIQKLAGHIRKIGLKEARRLYIEEPDKLFAVVEKN